MHNTDIMGAVTADEQERNARNLLRPDNRELFDEVCLRLNARKPVIPIQVIADDIGVSVDALCRWVIGFKESRRQTAYQSPKFAPLPIPKHVNGHDAQQPENIRRMKAWKKAHEGARATLDALGVK